MSSPLKERNEIDEQYRWDLSTLYASDEAFEEEFRKLDTCIANVAAFAGKLTDAAAVHACFEADTALDLLLSD
ncbi:MAG: oligoendopeptidase F, partial [Clostridia bacterium]|nr:oligoendopeptidase F [Clostridia bacterium]